MRQHAESIAPSTTLLPGTHTALLTTFRRNGQPVHTPVGVINNAGRLYFATRTSTGKVKRIRHTPRVTLAACSRNGTPTGPTFTAHAKLMEGDEAAPIERLFFGSFWGKLWVWYYRLRRPADTWIVYEVIPTTDDTTPSS